MSFKESCMYCTNLRRGSYKILNTGKSKLYDCAVHKSVCGWTETGTDKGLDVQGCSEYCGKLIPGTVFDLQSRFKKVEVRYMYVGSYRKLEGPKRWCILFRIPINGIVEGFEVREPGWIKQNIKRIYFQGTASSVISNGEKVSVRELKKRFMEEEENNVY